MAGTRTRRGARAAGSIRPTLRFACVLLGLAALNGAAPAQTPPPVLADPKAADLEAQRHAYQGLQDTLAQSEEQRKKIEAEIASYQNDRAALTAALIDARKKIEEAEAAAGETQNRLDTLTGSEAAIQRSLASRRDVLIAVLAALQRMGRKPPPALLAQPQDVLRAIRASMLLGAVLPELRSETEALANDLQDLVSLRASIAAEQADLAGQLRDAAQRARAARGADRGAAEIDRRGAGGAQRRARPRPGAGGAGVEPQGPDRAHGRRAGFRAQGG